MDENRENKINKDKSTLSENAFAKLEYNKIVGRLADNASFSFGRELAANIKPASDMDTIVSGLAETTEARELMRLYPTFSLGGIRDIRPALRHVEIGGVLEVAALVDIGDSCRAMRLTKAFFNDMKGLPILSSCGKSLSIFKTIETALEKSIAPDMSINDDASEKLYQVRRRLKSSNERIKERLDGMIKSPSKQKYLQEPIVTIRNNRYVIPVKQEYRAYVEGIVHDTSASGASLFIEPMAVVELNNDLQRLSKEEDEEIAAIMRALTMLVTGFREPLAESLAAMARLDFIIAKGKLSYDMDADAPKLNESGHIHLIGARHPLIPSAKVVPIDVTMAKSISAIIVTGPNTGGKTVTLKTVGLLTLMAFSGLHIPAEHGSELSLFDNIFVDIGDEQSIEQSLSTFSSHMVNIVGILKNAGSGSLVLLDEVGAGTDPAEGAALAMAILHFLKNSGAKTIATTHYSELKAFAYNNPGYINASMEFDLASLSPTYKLLIGMPGKSNAFEIASRLGIEKRVIEEATRLLTTEDAQVADLLANLEMTRREIALEREQSAQALAGIRASEQRLLAEEQRLKMAEVDIIREAHEKSRKIVAETAEKSETLYKELQERMDKEKLAQKAYQESKQKLKSWQEQLAEEQPEIVYAGTAPETLKMGDAVFVPKFNQKGTVLNPPNKNKEVYVQVGILKMYVALGDLRLTDGEKAAPANKTRGNIPHSKVLAIKTEIDLRGCDTQEALEQLDKYIDDAFVSGLKMLRIIHGKGTGVLRKNITEYLKNHRLVKNFRVGDYHEGGIGVTITELDI